MSESMLKEYYKDVEKFRQEIYAIPAKIDESNPTVNFESDLNHHQSIMIDVNGVSTTLADSFFLFAEKVENTIIKKLEEENRKLQGQVDAYEWPGKIIAMQQAD